MFPVVRSATVSVPSEMLVIDCVEMRGVLYEISSRQKDEGRGASDGNRTARLQHDGSVESLNGLASARQLVAAAADCSSPPGTIRVCISAGTQAPKPLGAQAVRCCLSRRQPSQSPRRCPLPSGHRSGECDEMVVVAWVLMHLAKRPYSSPTFGSLEDSIRPCHSRRHQSRSSPITPRTY